MKKMSVERCIQRNLDSPVTLLTTSEALLLIGKAIVSSTDQSNLNESVVGLIVLYYYHILTT